MKTLLEMKTELADRVRDMKDVLTTAEAEDRALNESEKTAFDRNEKAAEDLKVRIRAREETDARAAKQAAHQQHLDMLDSRITAPQQPVSDFRTLPDGTRILASDHDFSFQPRYGSLRAFDNTALGREDAFTAGQFCRAVLWKDQGAAAYCRAKGFQGFALGENPNSAGGFLVPDVMVSTIIRLVETYGVFRANVRRVPMGSETMSIPRRSSGVTATFTGESASLTESDPAWNQVNLTAKKVGVLTRTSSELAEDAVIDIGDWVAMEMAQAFALLEDQCGFIGDGTSTYGGIYGIMTKIIDGTHTASAIDAATNHDTFAEIDIDDLNTIIGTLPQYADRGARWFCSKMAKGLVFDAIAAAGGGNAFADFGRGPEPAFLGYPITISQVLPAGAATDYSNLAMLLLGNLQMSSTMGIRREMRLMTSDQRYFDTDQIGIKATTRFDIVNHDLGDTSTAGPMIALVGE